MGPDFQAELPPCLLGGDGAGMWSPEVESPLGETLFWKPLDIQEESLKDQGEIKTSGLEDKYTKF